MTMCDLTTAQKLARVALAFQEQLTGHAPRAVTVVLSADVLVITLHGALTPAEQALAADPSGALRVQEFHRELFAASTEALRKEIKQITGVDVLEMAAEVKSATGTVVHGFTSGTMVHVFQLAEHLPTQTWTENGAERKGGVGKRTEVS